MAVVTIKTVGYRCERCTHTWVARGRRAENRAKGDDGTPKTCPKCKSPYWETARKPPLMPRAK